MIFEINFKKNVLKHPKPLSPLKKIPVDHSYLFRPKMVIMTSQSPSIGQDIDSHDKSLLSVQNEC